MTQTLLDTSIPPDWEEIDPLRQEILRLLEEEGISVEKAYAISMVASELLENAVKYGAFKDKEQVSMIVGVHRDRLTLEVRNPTNDDQVPHLEKMDRIIQWIRGFQDPFQAYLARLGQVARLSIQSTESGLGLVRAAYEGAAVLDFYLDERGALAVFAVFDR